MLLWAALSFLPDADVIGFGLGVRYEDPWGHRGATHSLMFALALGTTLGVAAPLFRRPAFRTAVTASLVLGQPCVVRRSHRDRAVRSGRVVRAADHSTSALESNRSN